MNSATPFSKIGLFTLLCTINPSTSSNEINEISENKQPTISLSNVKLDSFSQEGNLALEIEATSLKQDTLSGQSHLTSPKIMIENPPGTLWLIQSQLGTVFRSGSNRDGISEQRIELSGDVLISRRTAKGQLLEIQSDKFILLPEKQYGETLSSVTLTSSNNLTRAGNLSIDLRRGEMKLQSSSTQYVETKIRNQ
tara:strand:+ start:2153 stop:2737 length:585 start_codon:yes stop_codon:yes gene_type:complete